MPLPAPPGPDGCQPVSELRQPLAQHWPRQWHTPSSATRLRVQGVGQYSDESNLPSTTQRSCLLGERCRIRPTCRTTVPSPCTLLSHQERSGWRWPCQWRRVISRQDDHSRKHVQGARVVSAKSCEINSLGPARKIRAATRPYSAHSGTCSPLSFSVTIDSARGAAERAFGGAPAAKAR